MSDWNLIASVNDEWLINSRFNPLTCVLQGGGGEETDGIKLLFLPIIADGDDNRLNDNNNDELPL
jgi:hypothetical protein